LYNNIELSQVWEKLLIGRGYSSPVGKSLHYSVGQPMGALSSWAMLALTHHFIVQCAAWRSGKIPVGVLFRKYAVLGDDIVIGDKVVANNYYKIIAQLGVKINLAKSVLSPNGQGFEFAKKTFCRGQNISAIPFKEYAVTSGSLPALIEFSRKYNMSVPNVIKMLGFGYKVLGSLNKKWVFQSVKIRRVLIGLTIPIDDASFNNWVSQFPKTVSSDTMFAFRAIIEKELSRISTWMSKCSSFLSHDLLSWQKEYCLFVTAFSNKKVTINKSTLPIPDKMRQEILDDPLAKRRTKFYWDAVQLTFNSLRFRMCAELQKVFASAFDLYSIDMMTLKVSDRAFFSPFKKYMELTKLMGKIPDKSFISMTRCEDDLSAKGLRDTLMTKIWVK
jgi:hypothetical protein